MKPWGIWTDRVTLVGVIIFVMIVVVLMVITVIVVVVVVVVITVVVVVIVIIMIMIVIIIIVTMGQVMVVIGSNIATKVRYKMVGWAHLICTDAWIVESLSLIHI